MSRSRVDRAALGLSADAVAAAGPLGFVPGSHGQRLPLGREGRLPGAPVVAVNDLVRNRGRETAALRPSSVA